MHHSYGSYAPSTYGSYGPRKANPNTDWGRTPSASRAASRYQKTIKLVHRIRLAIGGEVIKCPSLLNAFKDTCDRSCY